MRYTFFIRTSKLLCFYLSYDLNVKEENICSYSQSLVVFLNFLAFRALKCIWFVFIK